MFGVFAVEKFWDNKYRYFYTRVASTFKHLAWKSDLSKIENKPGLILFYSYDMDNKLVVDYVSTSCDLSRRIIQLLNEYSHYFRDSKIAYAYEYDRTDRYLKRNLLHSLRMPRVI